MLNRLLLRLVVSVSLLPVIGFAQQISDEAINKGNLNPPGGGQYTGPSDPGFPPYCLDGLAGQCEEPGASLLTPSCDFVTDDCGPSGFQWSGATIGEGPEFIAGYVELPVSMYVNGCYPIEQGGGLPESFSVDLDLICPIDYELVQVTAGTSTPFTYFDGGVPTGPPSSELVPACGMPYDLSHANSPCVGGQPTIVDDAFGVTYMSQSAIFPPVPADGRMRASFECSCMDEILQVYENCGSELVNIGTAPAYINSTKSFFWATFTCKRIECEEEECGPQAIDGSLLDLCASMENPPPFCNDLVDVRN